jgi:hypothetical protein
LGQGLGVSLGIVTFHERKLDDFFLKGDVITKSANLHPEGGHLTSLNKSSSTPRITIDLHGF